jgi:hypothetical protein
MNALCCRLLRTGVRFSPPPPLHFCSAAPSSESLIKEVRLAGWLLYRADAEQLRRNRTFAPTIFFIAAANWRRCQALKVLIGAVGPNSRILGRDDLWREPRAQHDYCGESRSSSVTLSRPVNLPSRNLKHEHDSKRTSTQNYGNYRIHSNIAVGR